MLPDVILTLFALEVCRDWVGAVPGERNEVMWIKWKNTERLESWRGFKRVIFENLFCLFFVIITSSPKFHPPTASPASSDTDWKQQPFWNTHTISNTVISVWVSAWIMRTEKHTRSLFWLTIQQLRFTVTLFWKNNHDVVKHSCWRCETRVIQSLPTCAVIIQCYCSPKNIIIDYCHTQYHTIKHHLISPFDLCAISCVFNLNCSLKQWNIEQIMTQFSWI